MSGPTDAIARARAILETGEEPDRAEVEDLAARLKRDSQFSYARLLLGPARLRFPEVRRLRTEQALCTYKDPELPIELRLDAALDVLGDRPGGLAAEEWWEALGIAGAIHKAKWEWDTQPRHLLDALSYYERGREAESGDPEGQAYCAINAAYVLDILASVEPAVAGDRREGADEARRRIVSELEPRVLGGGAVDWWVGATLLEALLGLDKFERAREVTVRMPDVAASVDGWQLESTMRQLAGLARLRHGLDSPEYERTLALLESWLGGYAPGLRAAMLGKVGVALSGGGFRASLFHLGVLAYLADTDMLRHVQVLSCVSGGSIAGAQYYLRLTHL